jgi:hypothetical protein
MIASERTDFAAPDSNLPFACSLSEEVEGREERPNRAAME